MPKLYFPPFRAIFTFKFPYLSHDCLSTNDKLLAHFSVVVSVMTRFHRLSVHPHVSVRVSLFVHCRFSKSILFFGFNLLELILSASFHLSPSSTWVFHSVVMTKIFFAFTISHILTVVLRFFPYTKKKILQ